MTRQSLKEESCELDSFTFIYGSKALSVSRLYLGKEGGYGVSTRQKAVSRKLSYTTTHRNSNSYARGKNHKHLCTAILLSA
jgi:hypothetical protein